jgi:hypothetical protein
VRAVRGTGAVRLCAAQPLGLGFGELAVEQERLSPADEVVCDQDEVEPHLIWKSQKGSLRSPVSLSLRM